MALNPLVCAGKIKHVPCKKLYCFWKIPIRSEKENHGFLVKALFGKNPNLSCLIPSCSLLNAIFTRPHSPITEHPNEATKLGPGGFGPGNKWPKNHPKHTLMI